MPMNRWITLTALASVLVLMVACTGTEEGEPASADEEAQVKAALQDRSFRQFDPSVGASPRKGIVLDFFDGLIVWAQYAEDETAINEWEVASSDFEVEKHGDLSEVTLHFLNPRALQKLPTECDDCLEPTGFSVSVRNVLDDEGIQFKLNFGAGSLPSPIPVFDEWTEFSEDVLME